MHQPATNLQKKIQKPKLILQQPTHYFMKAKTHQLHHFIHDTDITHQPCPIVLSTLTVKNNRTQLEKSDISKVTHTSYGNKLFKLTFILDTGFPMTLIREALQRKLNIPSRPIDPNFKIFSVNGTHTGCYRT